jgi:hypothetical protein
MPMNRSVLWKNFQLGEELDLSGAFERRLEHAFPAKKATSTRRTTEWLLVPQPHVLTASLASGPSSSISLGRLQVSARDRQ